MHAWSRSITQLLWYSRGHKPMFFNTVFIVVEQVSEAVYECCVWIGVIAYIERCVLVSLLSIVDTHIVVPRICTSHKEKGGCEYQVSCPLQNVPPYTTVCLAMPQKPVWGVLRTCGTVNPAAIVFWKSHKGVGKVKLPTRCVFHTLHTRTEYPPQNYRPTSPHTAKATHTFWQSLTALFCTKRNCASMGNPFQSSLPHV